MGVLIFPLMMIAVLLLFSRSDKKKRQQIESGLKKGDRVVTRAGLIGKITELSERTARLEIAPGVQVTMLKNAIEGPDGGDTVAPSGKPADKADKKDDKADKKDDKADKKDDKAAKSDKDASDKPDKADKKKK